MTLSNGSAVALADLTSLTTAELALLQADNAQLPAGMLLNLFFPNLVASTAATRRKSVFVVPFDCYLETLAVQASDFTGSSSLIIDVTGDGALSSWPLRVSTTVGGGRTKVSRLLYDNTKGKPNHNFATASRAFRVFNKGSTLTVTAETSSVATPSGLQVTLALREFFARE